MSIIIDDEKKKAFLEKARRGVLKFIKDKGNTASLSDMHSFSESKYFIAHQGFSKLMESLVDDRLVTFDSETNVATLTESGHKSSTD